MQLCTSKSSSNNKTMKEVEYIMHRASRLADKTTIESALHRTRNSCSMPECPSNHRSARSNKKNRTAHLVAL